MTLKPVFATIMIKQFVGSPIPCIDLTLFIYLNESLSFFDEYDCNLFEIKSSDKISLVSLCGEQTKPNFY